jgi:hypothetical protein
MASRKGHKASIAQLATVPLFDQTGRSRQPILLPVKAEIQRTPPKTIQLILLQVPTPIDTSPEAH